MARPKVNTEAMASISTRIKHTTMTRLDEYCKTREVVKGTLIDQLITDFLDKIEMTH